MADDLMVSCLTATHGRFQVLREALGCWVAQDYPNKELIILNNHPVPLVCDVPGVTILNEPWYETLGDCRNRLLREARGQLVRTWDDDDLYLPWAISQGVLNVAGFVGCKPAMSWDSQGNSRYRLGDNVYEAAMTVWTDEARKHGYKPSGGDEHHPLLVGLERDGRFNKFLVSPHEASYCYRWASRLHRISGTLGNGQEESARAENWKRANDDHGDGERLTPADVSRYFRDMFRAAAELESTWKEAS